MTRQDAPDLQQILEHTLQDSLSNILNEVQTHAPTFEELEQRVNSLETENAILNSRLQSSVDKHMQLEERMEDQENQSTLIGAQATGPGGEQETQQLYWQLVMKFWTLMIKLKS